MWTYIGEGKIERVDKKYFIKTVIFLRQILKHK